MDHAIDARLMRRALRLAQRGKGRTAPNPMVGAVVMKNGRVIGEGYHRRLGGPHAEVEALRAAGARARGGTLVVTLEPCNHVGRTAPCCDALIRAEIKRVVIGTRDPNPITNGRGLMPSYRRIPAGERWYIVDYLRQLQRNAAGGAGGAE